MNPRELFNAHLKICDHCPKNPFNLCSAGRELFKEAAKSIGMDPNGVDRMSEGAQYLADALGVPNPIELLSPDDDELEATGQELLGFPVFMRKIKHIDLNVFLTKHCINCGSDHILCVTLTSNAMGYLLAIGGDMNEILRDTRRGLIPRFKLAKHEFESVCAYAKSCGFVEVWRGPTIADVVRPA